MDGRTSINQFPFYQTSTDDWSAQLGQMGFGPDQDLQSGGTLVVNSVNGRRRYVFVQNDSGVALSTGMALKFTAGNYGTKVTKSSAGAKVCGYVPPSVNGASTNTVAIGAYFWMVVEGFTSVLKTTANVTEADEIEASATAGQVKANSGSGLSDVLAGTFIATDSGGTSNLVRAYANCQW